MRVYSNEFKAEIVKKHFVPGGKSVAVLSKEVGVSEQSIRNWIYKFNSDILNNSSNFTLSGLKDSDKLNLIFESKTISDDEIGVWLRDKGLKSDHIKLWEEQLKEKLNDKDQKLLEENRKIKELNRKLQEELQQKDKALAEMGSMLMLKKNYRSLFLGKDD